MNTIGFSINSASAGARRIVTCNDDAWSGSVVDIREYLKFFPAAFAEGQCIPYLTFDAEGCFITILRSIPGRVGDFLAGWLYVPNNIIVSGEELVSHIEFVKQVLHQTNLGSVKGSIDERFSQVYPESPAPRSFVSGGEKYGIRNPFAQGFSLAAILNNRHQDYYRHYKAIFLADARYLAPEYAQRFDNLTGQPLATYINVLPPVQPAAHFGQGVQIFLADGRTRFKAPVRIAAGTPFTIIVRRPGFPDKRFSPKVRDGQPLDIRGCSNVWLMRIERSNFNIVDENGRPVFNPQIVINSIALHGHIELDEGDCGNAMIEVSAPGYRAYSMPHNFLNKYDGIRIMLSSTNGAGASRSAGGAGRVNYSVNNSSKGGGSSFMYGLIAGLAVLVIGGGAYFLLKDDGSDPDGDGIVAIDGKDGGYDNKNLDGLRGYLEEKDKIKRQSLQNIGFAELFDDLNQYNMDAITGKWAAVLTASGHGDIVDAAKNHVPGLVGPYCDADDDVITFSTYRDKLLGVEKETPANNHGSNVSSSSGKTSGNSNSGSNKTSGNSNSGSNKTSGNSNSGSNKTTGNSNSGSNKTSGNSNSGSNKTSVSTTSGSSNSTGGSRQRKYSTPTSN